MNRPRTTPAHCRPGGNCPPALPRRGGVGRRRGGGYARAALIAGWLLLGVGAASAYVPYVGNVRVAPRDRKTATVHFDLSFGGWRNETNHSAVWVFFKVRAKGGTEWQPVRLVADRVVNPTGYRHGDGGPVEFVVPDGDEGFTGMFVRLPPSGKDVSGVSNVTAVWDFTANPGITKDVNVDMRAFGTMMAYVAEGPYYLGSGGTEWHHFYQYTDGTQHTKPYRVLGPGAIPTGPQNGKLWARKGGQPEDGGEIPAAFPNGYSAFYCMMFQISYTQYLGFLNTLPAAVADKYHVPAIKPYYVWHAHAGTQPMRIIRTNDPDPAKDPFAIEVHLRGEWQATDGRDRDLHGMSWADGAAWAAWAGLRPLSELEFEKICRGLRDPVPEEYGPSYWNITAFPNDPWPAHRRHTDRAVTVANATGRQFKGTHGRGTWVLPADWPQDDAIGTGFRGGGMSMPGARLSDRLYADYADTRRRPYCSFRCARTAPREPAPGDAAAGVAAAPANRYALKIEPLPDMRELDLSVCYLTGSFHNPDHRALDGQLTSSLPDACLVPGPKALAITAKPNADATFRILTVLTRQAATAARYGHDIPFRLQNAAGDLLADEAVRLLLAGEATPVIGSLEGGAVTLRIGNATDRPQTLALAVQPPPGVTLPETQRRVELAAGAQIKVTFPVPRQAFRASGVCRIPYRVTLAPGAPQAGELAADLRRQTRWWISRRIPAGPKLGDGDAAAQEDDGLGDVADLVADDSTVFKAAARPKAWESEVCGTGIPLNRSGPLPSRGSLALAATRVAAPSARQVVLKVRQELPHTPGKKFVYGVRVWLNNELGYDSQATSQADRKPGRLRQGANTLLIECRSENDGPADPGQVFVTFHDARDGKELEDLIFDMDQR